MHAETCTAQPRKGNTTCVQAQPCSHPLTPPAFSASIRMYEKAGTVLITHDIAAFHVVAHDVIM